MVTDETQRTLEGVPLDLLDQRIERAVERVLERHGIIEIAKRTSKWDRTYKGDDKWLEFRSHVVQLVQRNVAVAYADLDQDNYFRKVWGLVDRVQWKRAIDARLIPNKPTASDGRDFAAFALGGPRDTRYLTFRPWMHCAITVAARDRKDPSLIHRVREKYMATERCEKCGKLTEDQLVTTSGRLSPFKASGDEGLGDEAEIRAILEAKPDLPVSRGNGGD